MKFASGRSYLYLPSVPRHAAGAAARMALLGATVLGMAVAMTARAETGIPVRSDTDVAPAPTTDAAQASGSASSAASGSAPVGRKPNGLAADSTVFDTTSLHLALEPNRPNPFPVSTTIAYSIPADGHVLLTIHDFLFREVQTVVDEQQTAGRHMVSWPNAETTENLSSGMYFCTLTTSGGVLQLRMLLMK